MLNIDIIKIDNVDSIDGSITSYEIMNEEIIVLTDKGIYSLESNLENEKKLLEKGEQELKTLCNLKKTYEYDKKIFQNGLLVTLVYGAGFLGLSLLLTPWLLIFELIPSLIIPVLLKEIKDIKKNMRNNDEKFEDLIEQLESRRNEYETKINTLNKNISIDKIVEPEEMNLEVNLEKQEEKRLKLVRNS